MAEYRLQVRCAFSISSNRSKAEIAQALDALYTLMQDQIRLKVAALPGQNTIIRWELDYSDGQRIEPGP